MMRAAADRITGRETETATAGPTERIGASDQPESGEKNR